MIYINPITFYFSLFFNRVTALDLCTKCVSPKYLPNKWLHFEKSLLVLLSKFKMHTKSEHSGGVSWKLKLLWLLGQDVGADCISSWSLLIFLLWPYLGASRCWGHSVLQTLALVFCVNSHPDLFIVQNNSNSSSFVCSFHSNWWKDKVYEEPAGINLRFWKALAQTGKLGIISTCPFACQLVR